MLGFVTEVSLKLYPYKPENRGMHAYGVIGRKRGLDFIREVMIAGYKPAVVRLHDKYEVAERMGAPAPEGLSLIHIFLMKVPRGFWMSRRQCGPPQTG